MKKIFSILTILTIIFAINSCKNDGEVTYNGDSLLLFSAPQSSADVFVLSGTGFSDYNIPFGVVKQAETDSEVTLVVDAANSTAVEGVDFTIPNKTVTLKAGTATGIFPIKFLEGGAVQSGKTVAFKLSSNSLKNAGFNQNFSINVSLTCPVSTFVGNFTNTESWWNNPGYDFKVVESTDSPNQLIVKNFFDVGYDLTVNYDPATYIITVPGTQSTGYVHPSYGLIYAKNSTDATKISSFNPCTRAMTIYLNYFVSAGTYGNQKEVFQGN